MAKKYNVSESYSPEYFAYWDRYINFLESIGLVVTGYNPTFACYWKKDEYIDPDDGVRKFKADRCIDLTVEVVELMMKLKEGKI